MVERRISSGNGLAMLSGMVVALSIGLAQSRNYSIPEKILYNSIMGLGGIAAGYCTSKMNERYGS